MGHPYSTRVEDTHEIAVIVEDIYQIAVVASAHSSPSDCESGGMRSE